MNWKNASSYLTDAAPGQYVWSILVATLHSGETHHLEFLDNDNFTWNIDIPTSSAGELTEKKRLVGTSALPNPFYVALNFYYEQVPTLRLNPAVMRVSPTLKGVRTFQEPLSKETRVVYQLPHITSGLTAVNVQLR